MNPGSKKYGLTLPFGGITITIETDGRTVPEDHVRDWAELVAAKLNAIRDEERADQEKQRELLRRFQAALRDDRPLIDTSGCRRRTYTIGGGPEDYFESVWNTHEWQEIGSLASSHPDGTCERRITELCTHCHLERTRIERN